MIPKIRAWDKHVKKIRKVTEIHFDDSLIYLKANNGKGYYCSFSDIELMQSTGLRDKNGVEIFEGDIVEIEVNDGFDYGSFIGVVTYLEGAWMIDNRINFSRLLWSETEEVEILGSIHETPELLEGE